ncbi:hypothetical protein AB0I77_15880 [Streptomyces sp. NPDC050619]
MRSDHDVEGLYVRETLAQLSYEGVAFGRREEPAPARSVIWS